MATSSKMSILKVGNAISQLTTEEMRHLVCQLGVHLRDVDSIIEQYSGDMQIVHLVQKWLDTDPEASWDKLVAGLREISKNALATEIECEYLTRVLIPSSCSPSLPSTSSVSAEKVKETEDTIERLREEYFSVKCDVVRSLVKKEATNPHFLEVFQDYLLNRAVAGKRVHIRFIIKNEDEILRTIRKIFVILGRYCNYSNYEIIFNIVKEYCPAELKGRMERFYYRDSLTSFEKATTVDVYLCAISASPDSWVSKSFSRMCAKLTKPPSQCSLHEIRELRESIAEEASLDAYAVYMEI